jgi:hypothetical protein
LFDEHLFGIITLMVVIGEPVGVLVWFSSGKARLVRFQWKNQVVDVERITGCWRRKKGASDTISWSGVSTDGDYFEVSFNTQSLIWRLEKVETTG